MEIWNPPFSASMFRNLDDLCWAGQQTAGCFCRGPMLVCESPPGVPALRLSPAAGICYHECRCVEEKRNKPPPAKRLRVGQSGYCTNNAPCETNVSSLFSHSLYIVAVRLQGFEGASVYQGSQADRTIVVLRHGNYDTALWTPVGSRAARFILTQSCQFGWFSRGLCYQGPKRVICT